MASGGYQSSSQSSVSKPWGGQEAYLRDIYQRAQDLSQQPRSFYPGQTYVPFSGETETALRGITQRAQAGSPLLRGAQDYAGGVLRGDYLSPESNPYLRGTYDAAARGVTRAYQTAVEPGTRSIFEGAGRGGSGAEANRLSRGRDELARNLSEMAQRFYGAHYAQERGLQQQVMGAAAPLAEADYGDLARLGGVGQARQGLSQQILDDLMQRYYFGEDEPRERLAEYSRLIGAPVTESRARAGSSGGQASILWG